METITCWRRCRIEVALKYILILILTTIRHVLKSITFIQSSPMPHLRQIWFKEIFCTRIYNKSSYTGSEWTELINTKLFYFEWYRPTMEPPYLDLRLATIIFNVVWRQCQQWLSPCAFHLIESGHHIFFHSAILCHFTCYYQYVKIQISLIRSSLALLIHTILK